MATHSPRRILTPRDLDVLHALDRTPLTAEQMLKLSATFAHPFHSERMVRERLFALAQAGWVQSHYYALPSRGASPKCYQLTRTGFAILYGAATGPPTKRFFSPVGIARQHHTRCLADFLVHTIVGAHRAGVTFTTFYRENTLRLSVGSESLFPDSSFQLITPDRREWNFVVEVDNHTERLRSQTDTDSWERKLRLYHTLAQTAPNRFRLLVLTTRSTDRTEQILSLAAQAAPVRNQPLCYATSLPVYLAAADPIRGECFHNHLGRAVAMLPPHASVPATVKDSRVAA